VAILGLAYKALSHVVEESPGIQMVQSLSDAGYRVLAYDPLAGRNAEALLKYRALVMDSLGDCLRDAETILIMTTDERFAELSPSDFLGTKASVTIVDFWRWLKPAVRSHPAIHYVSAGQCPSQLPSLEMEQIWNLPPRPAYALHGT
jgi:UDPglucose 6-dehydrogenase